MVDKATASGVSETPWGQSWSDVLSSLRPVPAGDKLLSNIVARVDDALRFGGVEHVRVVAGGLFGKGTHSRGHSSLDLYAVRDQGFVPEDYFERHLKRLFDAISATKDSPFVHVEDRGLAVEFRTDGVECRLFAAGVLQGGPKDLLLQPVHVKSANGMTTNLSLDPRDIHVETSCALLRVDLIRSQCPTYKDMVRVARKWRDSCDFMIKDGMPNDYLVELLMLEAFHASPAASPSPDYYCAIFRRFLALVTSQSGTGSDVVASEDTPRPFLSWTTFYNRGTIDHCIAKGLLTVNNTNIVEGSALVVVDPAVPFINVAETVKEWSELRAFARDSLSHFKSTEMVEVLEGRLKNFSEGVQKTLAMLTEKLEVLEALEHAPRRWAGVVQFKDAHLSSDAWVSVMETELRCLRWIVHARRPRADNTAYHQSVDVSLQAVGVIPRQLDVDVSFRGQEIRLRFDETTDHVLIARKSEVMRNRDYQLQITVVS